MKLKILAQMKTGKVSIK